MIRYGQCLVLLFLLIFFLPFTALADRVVPITEKSRPDYDALGIRAGAFTIKPQITLATEYNDNIYAVTDSKTSDWIFTLAPAVGLASDWSRHSISFDVGAKAGIYSSESDENFIDGHALFNGSLDVTRDSYITGSLGFKRLHEDRGDPDAGAFWDRWDEPAVYYQSTGNLSFYQGLGRFDLTTGAGITNLDYRSVDLLDGTTLDQDDRDRNIYNVNARMAYNMHPEVAPFITTRYEWREYDESDVERDSEGYRIGIGTGINLGGLMTADIYGGYMDQDYDDRDNISGFWYGTSVLWNPTNLTSIQATAETSVKETTVDEASGIEAFDAILEVDHELRRNLLVGANAQYTYHDYEGEDVSDKYYVIGPSLTYLWNRNLEAELGYRYRTKDSNVSSREYTENRFILSLTGSF